MARIVASGLLAIAIVVVVGIAVAAIDVVGAYGRTLPAIDRLSDIEPTGPTILYARDGTVLARLFDKNRMYVAITQVPKVMRQAIVANEDERFYEHSGVDFRGIARAAIANYQGKRITQGASTITQQLARNLFLNDRRTVHRKIQEALLAMQIERFYTKDEILERYLNLVYFGAGAYGIQAASHTYFGEDVSRLTLPQAAMLAGIVAAPSLYSPYVNGHNARVRQHHVLDRMAAVGDVSRAQAAVAAKKPLYFLGQRTQGLQSYRYPYFTTYVIAELERRFGADAVLHGGLTVYTTLDSHMQDLAQNALTEGVEGGRAAGYGMHEGALVAEDPHTGEVGAMVGGIGFSAKNQFNRGWQARRQPGSSFKAYVYSAAVEQGVPVSTVYEDTPVSYPAGDGTEYSPEDDDHQYLGAITLRRAFELSRNVVAVKLAHDVGVQNVIDTAHAMGIAEQLNPDLSLALGTAVVSPLDMASGYSTVADGGVYIAPTGIRMVQDKYGATILDSRYPDRRIAVSAGTAWIMTTLMEGVIKEGTGNPNAVIGRPAAGKTGTTSDFRDAWFVGFVPQLTAAVWVGNDDYSRMYESYGGNVPARIWAAFMKSELADSKVVVFGPHPPDVAQVAVCDGGRRLAPPGYGGVKEDYLKNSLPLQYCYETPSPVVYQPRSYEKRKATASTPQPTAQPTSIVVPVTPQPTPTVSVEPSLSPAPVQTPSAAPQAPPTP
ncbi:MAG: PBP1A family penicillin-binding protein [Candidatus Eremiobacteraeota bacterium]|nr:PBP1A family penicillin-binding protein [Candidatus Eremiobacteraeota bacterium]